MKLVKVALDGSPVNYMAEIDGDEKVEKGKFVVVETSRGLEVAKTLCEIGRAHV